MAEAVRKATTHPSSNVSSVVASITSLIQTINPQNPNACEALKPFSPYLTQPLVIQVIKNLRSPNHALFFFNWASNPQPNPNNYSHTRHCYAAITDSLLSHSLFSTAHHLLHRSNNLSDSLICKFIIALGNRGDIRGAIHWFHKAKSFSHGRCLLSCNAVLGVLVRANRINLSKSIFDQVVEEGVFELDVFTYTTMIRGFCKIGMVHSALKVFDEMRCSPNSVTYNTLIHGFCKNRDMEGAKRVFDRMVEVGGQSCKPDVVTYTTLIDGYSKKGEFREALECMEEMVKQGCHPNVLTYNALIEGLCLGGNVDEAMKMMTRMRLNGLEDNVTTNTSIIKGFCTVGRSEEAIMHLKEMDSRGMRPDLKAYSVIVNEYCKIRKPDDALLLIREMVVKGIKPSVSSFNAVFRVLVDIGKLDEAVHLLKQMPQMGCIPNFLSYSIVICGLCKVNGRMQEVEGLVSEMLENGHDLDTTLYNCLLGGYCDLGDEEMALRTVYDMIDKNFVINKDTFCIFVKDLRGKGKLSKAVTVVEEMCRRCNVPDINSYRALL
ncbi:hypothetical protein HN51_059618 [Arachis hypogaea]|uniref:Pentatricopeptide repeat-containing protein n=1 Tax=Arachis hypogaea TaxID=3818 RepID=A0A444X6F6_ARAHY|nr:pentatricopeptide repeat-containing protein At4g11690-like [Arachis ipaensis]XP_025685432.1 pentatricopeptide repeat-containing protein At4g11690 [Arachis hypogaea]QHN83059.1 Pentatricopeptide repeat-containing protein [Arachis hypogaea]RYQ85268.1 hypothetical protein Ahy_B10g104775 [Arachis hypogaea]